MPRTLLFSSLFGLTLCLGLLLPDQAYAWGPGAHMVIGGWVLQHTAAFPLFVAEALRRYPGQFLHGSLSADIFIGKGSKAKKGHSHNWDSGFALLDRADTPQKQAYAYGYLAHLAADTVAHNVFVPGLSHTLPGKGRLAHVYLEIQADRLLAWNSRQALNVFYEKSSPKAAAMLRSSMRQKMLPFWIKTRLFQGGIAVGGSNIWRSGMRLLDELLPEHERGPLLERMLDLSFKASVSILREGRQSLALSLDPVGTEALSDARGQHLGRFIGVMKKRLLRSHSKAIIREPELSVNIPSVLETLPPVTLPEVFRL